MSIPPTSPETRQCPICLKRLKKNILALPCTHLFHKRCVKVWLKQHPKCPTCRFKCNWYSPVSSDFVTSSNRVVTDLHHLLDRPDRDSVSNEELRRLIDQVKEIRQLTRALNRNLRRVLQSIR